MKVKSQHEQGRGRRTFFEWKVAAWETEQAEIQNGGEIKCIAAYTLDDSVRDSYLQDCGLLLAEVATWV